MKGVKIEIQVFQKIEVTMIEIPKKLAVTGRVKDWLKNPESRLPVSCTVMSVEDSMEGDNGIESSWMFASKALRNAAGVAIDLSKLRSNGTENGKGLVSSGPVSFAKVYSTLNETLRRGGTYKNGAITLFLDYDHPDIKEYLNATTADLPWAKRAVYVDNNLLSSPHLDLIIQKLKEGFVWLAKKQYKTDGSRLYSNVCQEILLESRGTCLLSHINLGKCSIDDIPQAFEDGMHFLCNLHANTGVGDSGIYRSPENDKQVGLGVVGLANLLAINGVSYADFVSALEYAVDYVGDLSFAEVASEESDGIELNLAFRLIEGYKRAAAVAKQFGMERAFTIAPTASCAYRYRDSEGYTLAPEISPPINRVVDRDSGTFGVTRYEHNPNSETAREVGWDVQYRLMKSWQRMMDLTGLAHAISFNIWETCDVDRAFLEDWLASPLKTTYYRLPILQDALDKSQVITEEKPDMFAPVSENNSCSLDGFCVACAE